MKKDAKLREFREYLANKDVVLAIVKCMILITFDNEFLT